MPIEWAIADTAIRLSMVQLADICTKLEIETFLFRLGKHLEIFPMGIMGIFILLMC